MESRPHSCRPGAYLTRRLDEKTVGIVSSGRLDRLAEQAIEIRSMDIQSQAGGEPIFPGLGDDGNAGMMRQMREQIPALLLDAENPGIGRLGVDGLYLFFGNP